MPFNHVNILSLTPQSGRLTGGPNKVFHNLCKGLERTGISYTVNESPSAHRWNLVQSSIPGLIEVSLKRIPSLVGPNLVVLPGDLPPFLELQHTIFLHPAEWCRDSWKVMKYNRNRIEIWPVGIDWEAFRVQRNSSSRHVLIYFKRRHPELLSKALDLTASNNLESIVLHYGSYTEKQYLEALSKCKFGIWIGTSESQGIAQQEALASGLPWIIWDVQSFWDEYPSSSYPFPGKLKKFRPTSAPYFDERCGIIINDGHELPAALDEMLRGNSHFEPLDYIREHLTLEKGAQELLRIFQMLDMGSRKNAVRAYSIKKFIAVRGYQARKLLIKVFN